MNHDNSLQTAAEVARAIIRYGSAAVGPKPDMVSLLEGLRLADCPHPNAILIFAREVFESRQLRIGGDGFRSSAMAKEARTHIAETRCPYCRLLFCWFLAHNGQQNESECQGYEMIFARKLQDLFFALGKG